jgi:hypothetical protein
MDHILARRHLLANCLSRFGQSPKHRDNANRPTIAKRPTQEENSPFGLPVDPWTLAFLKKQRRQHIMHHRQERKTKSVQRHESRSRILLWISTALYHSISETLHIL